MKLILNKSYYLIAVVTTVHIGAAFLATGLSVTLTLKIGVLGLIGLSFWHQWRSLISVPIVELKIDDEGTCLLDLNGEPCRYRVTHAVSHAGFVRLTLQSPDRPRRRLLIARDALPPEQNRELRARIVQRRLPVDEKLPV